MAHFQRLIVYQQAKDLVKLVYALMKKFPADERYALCDQLRRSAISIPSNIAEGMGRMAEKEQGHFIKAFSEIMCFGEKIFIENCFKFFIEIL